MNYLHFILIILMGVFVGGIAGYLGSLMASKRMTLMAGALGHLTMPGISLALLYNFDVSIGALIFLIIGSSIIWLLKQKTKIATESLTATVFASSLAVSFLFLPKEKTTSALLGNISHIPTMTIIITILTSAIIFFVTKIIYNKMILASISVDLAKSEGIDIEKYNFVYLACISILVALGVKIVGGLLTSALVAIPSCISKNLSKNLKQYAYFSMAVGAFTCSLGIILSKLIKLPVGPTIIIICAIIFLVSIPLRKPY